VLKRIKQDDRSNRKQVRNKKPKVGLNDAKKHAAALDENLRFVNCGICEWEGPNVSLMR
jgi:hypothetical protein